MATFTLHDKATMDFAKGLSQEQRSLEYRKKKLRILMGLVHDEDMWLPLQILGTLFLFADALQIDREGNTLCAIKEQLSGLEQTQEEGEYIDGLRNAMSLLDELDTKASALRSSMTETLGDLEAGKMEDFFGLAKQTLESEDPAEFSLLEQKLENQWEEYGTGIQRFRREYQEQRSGWGEADLNASLKSLQASLGELDIEGAWIGEAMDNVQDIQALPKELG